MIELPLLSDLGDLKNKKILLRSDLNVPLQDGEITDEYRIHSSLPTILELQKRGARVTVCSHLGRPQGTPEDFSSFAAFAASSPFSMKPIAKRLSELVGDVEILENLRFSPAEEGEGREEFLAELIGDNDFFVNDAFGACHRAHTSIVGPPTKLPSAAGLLLEKEVAVLDKMLTAPRKPFTVILGGSKVSDKIGVIKVLAEKADVLAIGGAMAFSFLVAQGANIVSPFVQEEQIPILTELLNSELGEKIKLPEDLTALTPDGEIRQIGTNIPEGWEARDVGPGTAASYVDFAQNAGSIFWNGPLGVFEDARFMAGTQTLAEAIGTSKAYTIVGGGDSAAAIRMLKLENEIDHLSTGGGATLEFLEKGSLVGLDALLNAKDVLNS